MNGKFTQIPNINLSGIHNITNLAAELPLPTACNQLCLSGGSLLYHPILSGQAQQALSTPNHNIISQLIASLRIANIEDVVDRESVMELQNDLPNLLKTLISLDSGVIKTPHNQNQSQSIDFNFQSRQEFYENIRHNTYDILRSQITNSNFSNSQPPCLLPDDFASYYQSSGVSEGCPLTLGELIHQHAAPFETHFLTAQPGAPLSQMAPSDCSPMPATMAPTISESLSLMGQMTSLPNLESNGFLKAYNNSYVKNMYSDDFIKNKIEVKQETTLINPKVEIHALPEKLLKNYIQPSNEQNFFSKNTANDAINSNVIPRISLVRLDNNITDNFNISNPESQLKIKISKNGQGIKRMLSEDEDEAYLQGEYAMSLSERVKKSRRSTLPVTPSTVTTNHRHTNQSEDSGEDSDSRTSHSRHKDRHHRHKDRHRRNHRNHVVNDVVDEMMETPTFKKFYASLETALDAVDGADLAQIKDDDDDDDVGSLSSEAIISQSILNDLVAESAKLNNLNVTNKVPYDKLVKLLNLLQYCVRQGQKVVPLFDPDGDNDEEQLLRELTLDRVTAALDASLISLYLMTSRDMPKQVYIEDVMDSVIAFIKHHLRNLIYPEFDPVYRINSGLHSNMKMKRAKASTSSHRNSTISLLFSKFVDAVDMLAQLVDIQDLTDTIVLQISSLAVAPFFVENVPQLQLAALKLVTNIFSHYEKHRQLILEDILSSLARLPSSKKNFRSYRLNNEEHIQMVTALAMQLIQCVVQLPSPTYSSSTNDGESTETGDSKKKKISQKEKELVIVMSYETSRQTAANFLHAFLAKCTTKGDEDYRSLFENFVYDLLSTVNKPEWPAAELLLNILGNLLVKQFSSKNTDMSLRVTSLDYLGIVAARLRKDSIAYQTHSSAIDDVIKRMKYNEGYEGETEVCDQLSDIKKTEILQKCLLDYLLCKSDTDPSLMFSHRFYIAQWYLDCNIEIDRSAKKITEEKKVAKTKSRKKIDDSDEDTEDEEESKKVTALSQIEMMQLAQQLVTSRKSFLLDQIKTSNTIVIKKYKQRVDYETAQMITRYLASHRPFSQSFDIYLNKILNVLCENSVAVRSKALKCLTSVIEADPSVLARSDMQCGVHNRFTDSSTSVREAAVDLTGRFILVRPELTAQYYPMLSERILDTGISVRKRVIKIFRDICLEQPDFPQIPEMCVKMIRRVSDEEGIKKLVVETFQSMWFTPTNNSSRLLTRVINITDVVNACQPSGYEFLEQLVQNLLKKEEEQKDKQVEKSCTQIVDCLVENVLKLEESADDDRSLNQRITACFTTMYLFCKVRPRLLVRHCPVIQPYLNIKCSGINDLQLLKNVTRIFELALPLMEHPSESFLLQLEETMTKLIITNGLMIIQSCVSCLSSIVINITHNYRLVYDCFRKYYYLLERMRYASHLEIGDSMQLTLLTKLKRALIVVGLMCKHFDLNSEEIQIEDKMENIRDKVFEIFLYYLEYPDEQVRHKALTGIGFFVTRYYEFMLGKQLKDLYHQFLTSVETPQAVQLTPIITASATLSTLMNGEQISTATLPMNMSQYDSQMCCQVLQNLKAYLIEEENRMAMADAGWRKVHEKEDLKEMGDVQSGMASTIVQVYLKHILESFLYLDPQVRLSALEVTSLILNQGLINPQQCMAYLICMGSDTNANIRLKADKQILEIEKKYPGFLQARAMQGIKLSCRLQKIIQTEPVVLPTDSKAKSKKAKDMAYSTVGVLRGMRVEDTSVVALNAYIYSLLRNNRSNRRVLISNCLRMFEDKTSLDVLLYFSDNIAYFPYQLQDEPLYIIHNIDIILSVSGCNLLQSFKEVFYGLDRVNKDDDDEDEDLQSLLEIAPTTGNALVNLFISLQGFLLLLVLKQHLKDLYGFTDNKIQLYSPSDFKQFDRPVNRRADVHFQPRQTIELLARQRFLDGANDDDRREIIEAYLYFKNLMASIDREDNESDEVNANVNTSYGVSVLPQDSRILDQMQPNGVKTTLKLILPLKTSTQSTKRKPKSRETPRKSKLLSLAKKKKKRRHAWDDDDSESSNSSHESENDDCEEGEF